jgi:hypothetical protein
MKKLLVALLATAFVGMAFAEAQTKQVCHDKLDKQGNPVKKADGKVAQDCKTIKTHKKLEGTAVPAPAKK